MSNVVDLQEKKKKDLKLEHNIPLDTPLKLFPSEGTNETSSEEKAKKSHLIKKLRFKLKLFKKKFFESYIRPVRDYFYRKETEKLTGEFMALATKLNRKDFTVFVQLYGHVNGIEVRAHIGGWQSDTGNKNKVVILKGQLPGYGKYNKMKPKHLREAMKILISISKLNNIQKHLPYKIYE